MKKKCMISILLIFILTTNVFNSFATAEEGQFISSELPYNLSVTKVVDQYLLDSEGNLWEINVPGTIYDTSKRISRVFIDYKFSDIACGNNHTIALDKDGYLWAWGNNKYSQLGNGTTSDSTTPIAIYATKQFKSVYCGEYTSYAIDSEGKLYAWGSNKFAEVQTSNATITEVYSGSSFGTSDKKNTIPVQSTPKQILTDNTFQKISSDENGIIALDTDGYAWGWGENSHGEIGNYELNSEIVWYNSSIASARYSCIRTAAKISSTLTFKDISKGREHSILLGTDGKAYTLGRSLYGELGNGSVDSKSITLVQPTGLEDIVIKDIAAGYYASGFIDENGNVWTCGKNEYGILGNGTTTDSATVVKAKEDNTKFSSFANDNFDQKIYTFDLNNDLWGWGLNSSGELGIDNNKNALSPVQITGYKIEHTVTFKNGTEIVDTQTVTTGNSATAPSLTKVGYTLSWDKEFTNVTGDLTVNAVWTPNTNTAYKVEHYKQNTSLNGYEKADTDSLTGTTEATVTATPKTYTGFRENTTLTDRIANGQIAGDESLVLKLYYDRNNYHVALNTNGGTMNAGNVTTYTYGIGATLPKNVTKTGYTFVGWYDNTECIGTPVTSISTSETGDKTYYAKWTINKYTVTFKDGENVVDTQTVNYGSNATAPTLTKTGYTLSWDKPFDNVTGDLEVNAVWTINKYTVTFKDRGETVDTQTVTHGSKVTAPSLNRENYTLSWDKELTNITEDTTINAVWTLIPYWLKSDVYDIDSVCIGKVKPETPKSEFINGITTNGTIVKVTDAKGNELDDEEIITTASTLHIEYEGKMYEYKIAVLGDLDNNGKITITDLSVMNQGLTGGTILDTLHERAGDLDYNKKMTVTDLSILNQAMVGAIEL